MSELKFDAKQFEQTKEGSTVVLTYKDEDVYKKGTDIPFQTLKEVADYNNKYVSEAAEISVAEAKKVLEKDKTIEVVDVKIPYSVSKRGFVNTLVEREKTVRIPGKDGGEKKKSAIKVIVKNPLDKFSKPRLKELEADLTAKFVR